MPKLVAIHKVGNHQGTIRQLAKITQIAEGNMRERLKKFESGVYSAEKTMTIGPLSTMPDGSGGNAEWDSLSRFVADARLQVWQV